MLLAEALVPIVRHRLRLRGAAGDEESIELLGTALAAAHDRTVLLPVILQTVVEATGAVGGVLLEGGEEISAIGERPSLVEPLVVEVAADVAWSGNSFRHPLTYQRARPEPDPTDVGLPAHIKAR